MATTWQGINKKEYPKLEGQANTEVVIVGGGLTGIISAYLLAKAGKKVAVLESDSLGSWATIDTTAFITQILDTDFSDLTGMFGEEDAKLIWESGKTAIDEFEKIINEENINCEFSRCSVFEYANNAKEFQSLEKEDQAFDKLKLDHDFKRDERLVISDFGFLQIQGQAKFHPMKFLYALAEKAEKLGVQIWENTEALKVLDEGHIVVQTKNGKVIAEKLIVASYYPFNNPRITHYKKGMYRSYVFEVEVPKMLEEGLYWDQHNPYHYIRIDEVDGKFRMIIGGEDHRDELKMDKEKNFRALEEYLQSIMRGKQYTIAKKWSGPILEPSDGLALIGEYEADKFVATAFSGNGMTYAMIAGIIFRDLICKKENPWQRIYDPTRKLRTGVLFKKGMDYTEEFFGAAAKNIFR